MTFTDDDAIRVKKHLLTQLENFPENKRDEIKNQIESMTTEQTETFIEQNKLGHLSGNCIFCSITRGDSKSYKIGGNESNIAILEINPLSEGHALIVPLEHENGITDSTRELAKEISDKLRQKFEPKTIDQKEKSIMDHSIIELIPIYGGEAERHEATEEELKELQEEILKEIKVINTTEETGETPEEETESIPKLPPRIP